MMPWWGLWWGAAVAGVAIVWESTGLCTHLKDLPTGSRLHEFAPAAFLLFLGFVLLILGHWSVLLLLLVGKMCRGRLPSKRETNNCCEGYLTV
jgi:hypothetical protein